MVRKLFIIGWAMAVLLGCQSDDYLTDNRTLVRTDLALSVMATTPSTRMSTPEVLETDSRDIQDLTIVPFSKQGKITSADRPSYYEGGAVSTGDKEEDENGQKQKRFFYSQQYYLMPGAASFLVYGRAKTIKQSDNSTVDKSANGSLLIEMEGQSQTSLPTSVIPATLKFKPEPMYDPTPVNNQIPAPDEAKCIAAYLTAIADVYGQVESTACRWREAPNAWLKALYLNYINQGNDRTYVLAGSARNVKAYVNQLYLLMKQKRETNAAFADGTMPGAIAQAIMDKITDTTVEYKSGSLNMKVSVDATTKVVTSLGVCDGYPNNRDLPDGATVLLWGKASESTSSNSFIPQVETTTMNSVNSISRFAYPAELYYYGNSRIKTNNEVVEKSVYENASATWAGVLGNYHYDDAIVTTSTKAIAIKDPLQYGVARLSAKVHATSGTLKDADNVDVIVGAESFPITGIIIDKQRPVGFDFKPWSSDEADVKFVYDSHLNTNTGNTNYYLSTTEAATPFLHTLVLQNCEDEDVTVILELQNDSGQDFAGENGVIYKGTKFYLVGKITKPTYETTDDDYKKRVFTQDHTTTVGMKVGSLAHAYNVLPDLLGGRLEIGVQITTDWEAATPSTVIFK